MCGIVGIIDRRGDRTFSPVLIERMNTVQHHRGPDETGVHLGPGVALGHKRLSIIDLASGQQPMWSADGRYVIIYNGEVYNFEALRAELKAEGFAFRTRCDTEVLLNAYAAWGPVSVERFRGMFAYAVWDTRERSLFLARDRLGIKPLYWCEFGDGRVAFASELKSLMVIDDLPRAADPRAVEDYMALGYVPEPRTIFAGVQKLAPGHWMLVERGTTVPAPTEYWDVPFTPVAAGSETDAAAELIERVRDAVKVRMIADVPLGAFLSGGVDSSAVVAMMAGLSPDPVKTCSISFGERGYDESSYAARIARRYATDHRAQAVDPQDFGLLDELGHLYDEPFADSSALPTYRVCQLARQTVTVALSGDGGDENLAGYRRHRWHMAEERIRGLLPGGLRQVLFGTAGRLYPKLDWAPRVLRAKSTFQALARDSVEAYLHSVGVIPDHQRMRLYSSSFRSDLQGYHAREVFAHHAARAPTDHPLSLVQYLDLKTYLPGDILTKVDRASMAHALEVRVPLLDHSLVEWISGLDPSLKLRGREGKYLFKKALQPYVDPEVMYRPKMGFAVPVGQWFRGPLRQRLRESLLGPTLGDCGMFDMDSVARLVREHQSGIGEHSAALWSLLMLETFLRRQASSGKDKQAA